MWGPPVYRGLIAPLPLARASDFRFEIAGGKGRAITDLNRFEITIKKCDGVPIAQACCCGASLLPIASPRQAAMVCSPNKRAACDPRSEEHTSELQSLMRISYAALCLNNNNLYI